MINHLELFAGIGGLSRAAELLYKDFGTSISTIAYSEIDKHAIKTYRAIHPSHKYSLSMGDLIEWNQTKDEQTRSLDIDLLSGGFPCQTFSSAGKRAGMLDPRGTLFYEILHILEVKLQQGKPIPYILLENVRGLTTHDKGNTFRTIKTSLENLGYTVYWDLFNAADYKLAQNRNRLIIFATTKSLPSFTFNSTVVKNTFNRDYSKDWSLTTQTKVRDILKPTVDPKYNLSKSPSYRSYILGENTTYRTVPKFDRDIAATLTCKSDRRASMGNYYTLDYIQTGNRDSSVDYKTADLRKITPTESFLLQGFREEDVKLARSAGVSDTQLYKQAGNTYSVNMFYAVLYYLFLDQRIQEKQ
ncbi:DNA cytosine methyltransferase [Prevotella fusca]|uniref:Cytosine-specific methyltransferase n=1 Tax=Prevotella fusca JCM 17724 TaxID=1236517 RepID=A0ABX7Y2L1_9BACT|nr:DNA (cytosine-5-)-methyltransferase [Prevotella fusca]QUB87572.1 DNA (cytosine-5-)-methyltransferase [Prevotella fusca JCM 17724]